MSFCLEIWLLYAATCSAAGWLFSFFHILNGPAYLILHIIFFIFISLLYRSQLKHLFRLRTLHKIKARFFPARRSYEHSFSLRRLLPASFLLLAFLALIAGCIYSPNNFDALTYRLPRVLYWLQDNGWSWLHTINVRLNNRATGFEWLIAPQLSLLHTDRLLFLLNYFSFLLLPGLLFCLLRQCRAQPRTAWLWMWLFPTGYGYLLQSSSICNDAFATAYALSATTLALRFARENKTRDLLFCLLSCALLTGAKASNLPLLLPVFLLLIFSWKSLLHAWRPLLAIILPLILASLIPAAYLNWKYCGDWTGTRLESSRFVSAPWIGLVGNFGQTLAHNFTPPVLPNARALDSALQSLLPSFIREPLRLDFEGGFTFGLGELPTEASGLGFGVSLCLLVASIISLSQWPFYWRKCNLPIRIFLISAPLTLVWFFTKTALAGISRVVLPYFPIVLAFILAASNWPRFHRSRLFRLTVLLNLFLAILTIVIDPSRPLWPAQTLLSHSTSSPLIEKLRTRALSVYANYGSRSDVFSPLRQILPPAVSEVGFFNGGDDPVSSLWKPYGSLIVREVTPKDNLASLQARGLHYIFAGERGLHENLSQTIEQWTINLRGSIVATTILYPAVSRGPEAWVLVLIP
jgi:hypothetical protein